MATKMIFVALCLAICLIYVNAGGCGTESAEKCSEKELKFCKDKAKPGYEVICERRGVCQFTCIYRRRNDYYEITHYHPRGTPCVVNGRPGKCDGGGNCIPDRSAATAIQCE